MSVLNDSMRSADRLFREAQGTYICYLDGDDFYTDPYKLQKQADILDADTEKKYVACGHNGCFYWQSTGKTRPDLKSPSGNVA